MGISYFEMGKLNPRKVRIIEKAYFEKERKKDEEMWIQGKYFMQGLLSALDKALSGGKNDVQYFEKPIFADMYDEMLLTPEELEKKRINEMLRAEERWRNAGRECGLQE